MMYLNGWELALIIFAITVMIVNVTNCVVQIMSLARFNRLFTKSALIMEKILDKSEKHILEAFDED